MMMNQYAMSHAHTPEWKQADFAAFALCHPFAVLLRRAVHLTCPHLAAVLALEHSTLKHSHGTLAPVALRCAG